MAFNDINPSVYLSSPHPCLAAVHLFEAECVTSPRQLEFDPGTHFLYLQVSCFVQVTDHHLPVPQVVHAALLAQVPRLDVVPILGVFLPVFAIIEVPNVIACRGVSGLCYVLSLHLFGVRYLCAKVESQDWEMATPRDLLSLRFLRDLHPAESPRELHQRRGCYFRGALPRSEAGVLYLPPSHNNTIRAISNQQQSPITPSQPHYYPSPPTYLFYKRGQQQYLKRMQTEFKKQDEGEINPNKSEFSLNYYIGHQGRFGHQYLDFEFRKDGRLKYYNCTEYKKEDIIRKEVYTNDIVIDELKKIIRSSGILEHTAEKWPKPDKTGKQTLEIRLDGKEYKFETTKIGSFSEVQNCEDPQGLTTFFYFVLDLKGLVFSLVNLHFRIRPV